MDRASSHLRIGLMGGTFNPPHRAHLMIAKCFAEQLQLDTVYLVPAACSPFKTGESSGKMVSDTDRVAMLRLAAGEYPDFQVATIELERGGVSYTVDTIDYFAGRYPGAGFFLLVGADQAAAFSSWKEWRRILEAATLCIADRPGVLDPAGKRKVEETLRAAGAPPVWIDAPLLDISATDLRARVANGRSISSLVPDSVDRYIRKHGLYREAGPV